MTPHYQKGFVALISAIVISVALLLIVAALSFSSFYGRYNILDAELKERSLGIAEACGDHALLELTNDPSYTGNATTTIGSDSCYIGPVVVAGAQRTFKTRSMYKNYYSNLEISFDTSTFSVLSWKEIPNF